MVYFQSKRMSLESTEYIGPRITNVLSRRELAGGALGEFDQPEERSLLRCLQRISAIPHVEGLAFSRIKGSGGAYYTVVERHGVFERKDKGRAFREIISALSDFGDDLNEVLPGSFYTLAEDEEFEQAVEYFGSEDYTSELNLLSVIRFVE